MKITQTATTVIAEAETISEALQLLQLVKEPKAKRKYTKRGGHNAWKGKHRHECMTCHKKYKNMKLHQYRKHGVIPLKELSVNHEG